MGGNLCQPSKRRPGYDVHPVVGSSWEGFVIENLLSCVPPRTEAYFYRTSAGAEIDLILKFRTGESWAIEIKRSDES